MCRSEPPGSHSTPLPSPSPVTTPALSPLGLASSGPTLKARGCFCLASLTKQSALQAGSPCGHTLRLPVHSAATTQAPLLPGGCAEPHESPGGRHWVETAEEVTQKTTHHPGGDPLHVACKSRARRSRAGWWSPGSGVEAQADPGTAAPEAETRSHKGLHSGTGLSHHTMF